MSSTALTARRRISPSVLRSGWYADCLSKRLLSICLPKVKPSLSPDTFLVGSSASEKIQSSRRAFDELSDTSTPRRLRAPMKSASLREVFFASATRALMSPTHE